MRKAIIILLFGLLSGCSSSPSPIEPPVKLEPLDNELRISSSWHRDVGKGVRHQYLRFEPIWNKEIFYTVEYTGNIYAINSESGQTLWQKNYTHNITAGLAQSDNAMYFATENGKLFSVNKTNGDVNWQAKLTSEALAVPLVVNNALFVRTVDGNIAKLDMSSGKVLWVHTDTAPPLSLRGTSHPVAYGKLILSGSDQGKIYALDQATGNKIWEKSIASPKGRTEIERLVDIDANMIVVNDLLFTVTYQGRIACMHTETGRIIWTRDFSSYTGMTLETARLYITDSVGYVWALDPRTGATVWKQDKLLRRSLTKPVLQNEYVVVADFNGFIHWLAKSDGHLVARTRLADEPEQEADVPDDLVFDRKYNIISSPVVQGNKLIATTRFGFTSLFSIN